MADEERKSPRVKEFRTYDRLRAEGEPEVPYEYKPRGGTPGEEARFVGTVDPSQPYPSARTRKLDVPSMTMQSSSSPLVIPPATEPREPYVGVEASSPVVDVSRPMLPTTKRMPVLPGLPGAEPRPASYVAETPNGNTGNTSQLAAGGHRQLDFPKIDVAAAPTQATVPVPSHTLHFDHTKPVTPAKGEER